MSNLDLLNFVEKDGWLVDVHIVNNKVVGFYKTREIMFQDSSGKRCSYYFPVTVQVIDNYNIEIAITFGSVPRDFNIYHTIRSAHPTDENIGYRTMDVGYHVYKLLMGVALIEAFDKYKKNDIDTQVRYSFDCYMKSFTLAMLDLDSAGFKFITINKDNYITDSY